MTKKMELKTIILTTVVTMGLTFVTIAQKQNPILFNGRWCNNESLIETGEVFQLEISTDSNGVITATYYSGGPFEENYTGELSIEGNLNLYFNSVGGSISFNNLNNSGEKNCQNIKFATCKLILQDKIEVITYENDCSYMPANSVIILKRLAEDESCN
jgi:hypothetical protein